MADVGVGEPENGAASRPGSAAGALLAGYEREHAWVEQNVSRSEAAIDEMQVV